MADIRIYQERPGVVPLLAWLKELDPSQRGRIRDRIALLADQGHNLRRPHADMLRDGIHELRARAGHVQLRVLYCFTGREIVLLTHGFVKPDARVDAVEIERAIAMRRKYLANPEAHTYTQEG